MLAGAALILALAVPLAFTILRVPPPSISTAANLGAENHPASPPSGWTRAKALRSLAFWSVSAPFAIAITSQCGFLVHPIAFLEQCRLVLQK